MNKLTSYLLIPVMLLPCSIQAEDKSLQEQLDEIRIMIEREQIRNIELKAELAKKEQEAEELRQKLQQIEDQIVAIKAQHNLN
jgi:septal ring factor EnvC (AmiA/AmiB activator)